MESFVNEKNKWLENFWKLSSIPCCFSEVHSSLSWDWSRRTSNVWGRTSQTFLYMYKLSRVWRWSVLTDSWVLPCQQATKPWPLKQSWHWLGEDRNVSDLCYYRKFHLRFLIKFKYYPATQRCQHSFPPWVESSVQNWLLHWALPRKPSVLQLCIFDQTRDISWILSAEKNYWPTHDPRLAV